MTKASEELLRLAERCEKAIFPCPDDTSAAEVVAIRSAICQLITGRPYDTYSPDYVASLDAAMTLVPEGCGVLMNTPGSYVGKPWAHINLPHDGPIPKPVKGVAATLALALCAAALRALANKATPHG